MGMLAEIHQQAEAVERMLAAGAGVADRLGPGLVEGVDYVVVAARGTSDNAARYAQYVWGARNRLPVALATPSLFGLYRQPPSLAGALVVGISQSGQSPDLVSVLAEARRQGRPTVTITNHPDSPLAEAADVVVDLAAGVEEAVAATKTYTAQLAAVAMISELLAGHDPAGLGHLPGSLREVIAGATAPGAAQALAPEDRCVVLGRGFHFASAHEWALKLQELTQILAQPYSAADFRHGPLAVLEEGFPVLAVVSSGEVAESMAELLGSVREKGAEVTVITDRLDVPADHRIPIPVTDEWLAPIVAAPALQLHAHAVTVARGMDPDRPEGLSKVTRTR